jgi:hypothetical protein
MVLQFPAHLTKRIELFRDKIHGRLALQGVNAFFLNQSGSPMCDIAGRRVDMAAYFVVCV